MSDYVKTEVDEHGNIKITSYVEAVVISKEGQEQTLRTFKKLQEESAELRKERDYLLANESPTACEVRRVRSYMKDVKAENAKLRELAHDALLYGNERLYGETLYKLKEMARELGIEVGE